MFVAQGTAEGSTIRLSYPATRTYYIMLAIGISREQHCSPWFSERKMERLDTSINTILVRITYNYNTYLPKNEADKAEKQESLTNGEAQLLVYGVICTPQSYCVLSRVGPISGRKIFRNTAENSAGEKLHRPQNFFTPQKSIKGCLSPRPF